MHIVKKKLTKNAYSNLKRGLHLATKIKSNGCLDIEIEGVFNIIFVLVEFIDFDCDFLFCYILLKIAFKFVMLETQKSWRDF